MIKYMFRVLLVIGLVGTAFPSYAQEGDDVPQDIKDQAAAMFFEPLTDGTASNMDPDEFLKKPYNGLKDGNKAGSLASLNYTFFKIKSFYVCDKSFADKVVAYTYPEFYTPTWKEYFDSMARQLKADWTWDEEAKQFKFCHSYDTPFFSVDLSSDWMLQDRGLYIWYAPHDLKFGMDVYYMGHYTIPSGDGSAVFKDKVLKFVATRVLEVYKVEPLPSPDKDMRFVDIDGEIGRALLWEPEEGLHDRVWRQWAFLVDGHAFIIENAAVPDNKDRVFSAVDKMLPTFKIRKDSEE